MIRLRTASDSFGQTSTNLAKSGLSSEINAEQDAEQELSDLQVLVVSGVRGLLHCPVGAVHGADNLHSCQQVRFALRSKLGGGKDVFAEQFDFVASELLDVLAPDAGRRLGENLDGGVVDEAAFLFADGSCEEPLETFGDELSKVVIHSRGLFAGTAKDSYLAVRFEDAIEQCCYGCQFGFTAGAICPYDCIGVGVLFSVEIGEKTVGEIVQGAVMACANMFRRDVYTEEDFDVVFEAAFCCGSGSTKCVVKSCSLFDFIIIDGLRLQ